MESNALRQLFEQKGALIKGHFFRLSGRHTDWYVQCARLFEDSATGEAVGKELAARSAQYQPDAILAAAIGGLLPGYEVARALNKPLFYCEKRDGALILRRGFTITPGMKVLLVEDEVSTVKSVREMMEIVRALGGSVVGIACLVDKSGGDIPSHVPLCALVTLKAEHYQADACPMCQQGLPLQNLR